MILIRPRDNRGKTTLGWLDSRHTFAFGDYVDPEHMGFRALRVINEDRVIPGAGFPPHAHRDMEIVTYVLEGALEHKDTLGNSSVIRPGEVQRMSAGTGIRHSEYNASKSEPVHFLQIWLLPGKPGIAPGYEQRDFAADEKRGKWQLVASQTAATRASRSIKTPTFMRPCCTKAKNSLSICGPGAMPGCKSRAGM